MSMLSNLDPEIALQPFKSALGKNFEKIVLDTKAMLGRVEKDIVTKAGEWKATASFKLQSKEGRTVQLASNNPAAILLCYGMRIIELADKGEFEMSATIPKNCEAWVQQHSIAPALSPVIAK